MKQIRKLALMVALGFLTGCGLALIFYFMMMPAKPFVYVGF